MLREQMAPQKKEALLFPGPRGAGCWLPGPPAIVTSVPRCSVSIGGPCPPLSLPPRVQLASCCSQFHHLLEASVLGTDGNQFGCAGSVKNRKL